MRGPAIFCTWRRRVATCTSYRIPVARSLDAFGCNPPLASALIDVGTSSSSCNGLQQIADIRTAGSSFKHWRCTTYPAAAASTQRPGISRSPLMITLASTSIPVRGQVEYNPFATIIFILVGLCAYDSRGNLFLDGAVAAGRHHSYVPYLAELPKGSTTFNNYRLYGSRFRYDYYDSINWDGAYVTLSNPSTHSIYRVQISHKVRIVGRTREHGWHWWIRL